jgi:sugar phosphate isomerase/epimerase
MRLGAMHLKESPDPEAWARSLVDKGYRAAALPCAITSPDSLIREFGKSAAKHGIVIAEVGAWGNVLRDSDRTTKAAAMEQAQRALYVAEEIGASCAVNIAGSRASQWDGPDEKNMTSETHAMIVDSVRAIIDAVRPRRSFYTLEPMPWMYPCDIATQRSLLRDVDRPGFAVHFDPVNMIRTVDMYYANGRFMTDFIREFGPLIKSVHAKDTLLSGKLTVHLQEVRPGLGRLDYRTLLTELQAVSADMPLLIEHLSTEQEYVDSTLHVRAEAEKAGIPL